MTQMAVIGPTGRSRSGSSGDALPVGLDGEHDRTFVREVRASLSCSTLLLVVLVGARRPSAGCASPVTTSGVGGQYGVPWG